MRALALPITVLVVVLAAALLVTAFRRPAPDRAVRWEAAADLKDDVTVVMVRQLDGDREVGRQVIAEIPAGSPDWETRYHEAMALARSRVAALRSEAD